MSAQAGVGSRPRFARARLHRCSQRAIRTRAGNHGLALSVRFAPDDRAVASPRRRDGDSRTRPREAGGEARWPRRPFRRRRLQPRRGGAVLEQSRRRHLRVGHRRRPALRTTVPLRRARTLAAGSAADAAARRARTAHSSSSASADRGSRSTRFPPSGDEPSSVCRLPARSPRSPGHPTAIRSRSLPATGRCSCGMPGRRLVRRLFGLDAVQAVAFARDEPLLAAVDHHRGSGTPGRLALWRSDTGMATAARPLDLPGEAVDRVRRAETNSVGRKTGMCSSSTRRLARSCARSTRREPQTSWLRSRLTELSSPARRRAPSSAGTPRPENRSAVATLVAAGPVGGISFAPDANTFSTTGSPMAARSCGPPRLCGSWARAFGKPGAQGQRRDHCRRPEPHHDLRRRRRRQPTTVDAWKRQLCRRRTKSDPRGMVAIPSWRRIPGDLRKGRTLTSADAAARLARS